MAENKSLVAYQADQGEVKLSPDIVKRYLVNGDADKVTDQEVMMFIKLCQYQGLNPFLREAYLIKYGNQPATMVTGKDTFTKRAAKSEKCAGYEAGIIVQKKDGNIEQRKGSLVLPGETLVGGWASVYRKDWKVPMEVTVSLQEYQRYNSKGELMRNWKEMPATMIRKVALVQALREAIPEEFGGLYSPEEMPIDDSKLDEAAVEVPFEVQEPPKETVIKTNNNDRISAKQARRMFALAKGHNDIVRQVLDRFNYVKSTDVLKSDYDKICEVIEEMVRIKESEAKEDKPKEDAQELEKQQEVDEDIPLPWESEEDENA